MSVDAVHGDGFIHHIVVCRLSRFTITFDKIIVGFVASSISVANAVAYGVTQISVNAVVFTFKLTMSNSYHGACLCAPLSFPWLVLFIVCCA